MQKAARKAPMRRILLTLAEDTTETECGSCEHLTADVCHISGPLAYATRGAKTPTRHVDCLAAEAAAARMIEIAPEDLVKVRFDLWAPSGEDDGHEAVYRVEEALNDHAAKAEVKR
jgi:hypothetical protein